MVNEKPKILFLSHSKRQCGVYQYGINICSALTKSEAIEFIYAECDDVQSFFNLININRPNILLVNYYPYATMPWLEKYFSEIKNLLRNNNILFIGTFHESTVQKILHGDHSVFDYVLCLDPTLQSPLPSKYIPVPRLIVTDNKLYLKPQKLTIASFGFPCFHKGFIDLIHLVKKEFTAEEVVLKLHLPSNNADPHQTEESQVLNAISQIKLPENISLKISRDFLSTPQVLEFLGTSHLNCFLYHKLPNRGISSCLDHALGVKVPIALSNSNMFRHILCRRPEICIDNNSLTSIMNLGLAPLQVFYEEWSEDSFRTKMVDILSHLG